MALPFVATVIRRFSQSCFYLPLGILFVTQFVLPFISSVSVVFGYSPISGNTALDISFLGGAYGVYVVLGFYLYKVISAISITILGVFFCRDNQLHFINWNVVDFFGPSAGLFDLVFRFTGFDCQFLSVFRIAKVSKVQQFPRY